MANEKDTPISLAIVHTETGFLPLKTRFLSYFPSPIHLEHSDPYS